MPTNQTETENYEDQLKGKEEKPQQNAQPIEPQEQEHTDDIEGFDDDTEEHAAGAAATKSRSSAVSARASSSAPTAM